MANEYLLSEYADIPALQAQTTTILGFLKSISDGAEIAAASAQKIGSTVNLDTSIGSTKLFVDAINSLNAATKTYTDLAANAKDKIADQNTSLINSGKSIDIVTNSLNDNIKSQTQLQASLQKSKDAQAQLVVGEKDYSTKLATTTLQQERYTNSLSQSNKVIQSQTNTKVIATRAVNEEIRTYADLSNKYKKASTDAKDYAVSLGAAHPTSIQAATDAKALGNQLKDIDASVGQNGRNVGNYSEAIEKSTNKFTLYGNALRSTRGPVKLLGEAFGFSAFQADQFRLIIEHSLQTIGYFTKSKQDAAAAQDLENASTVTAITTKEGLIIAEADLTAANIAAANATEALAAAEADLDIAQKMNTDLLAEQTLASVAFTEAQATQAGITDLIKSKQFELNTVKKAASTAITAEIVSELSLNNMKASGVATTAALAESEANLILWRADATNATLVQADVEASLGSAYLAEAEATELVTIAEAKLTIAKSGTTIATHAETLAQTNLTEAQGVNIATSNAQAAAQELVTGAVIETTIATKILTGALIATGIGAFVILIGILIAKWDDIKTSLGFATEAQKDYNKSLEGLQKGAEQGFEAVNKMQVALAEINDGFDTGKEFIDAYNNSIGKFTKQAKDIEEAKEGYKKDKDAYIEMLELKLQAESLFQIAKEHYANAEKAKQEDNVSWYKKTWIGLKEFLKSPSAAAAFITIQTKIGEANIEDTKKKIASERKLGDDAIAEGLAKDEEKLKKMKEAGFKEVEVAKATGKAKEDAALEYLDGDAKNSLEQIKQKMTLQKRIIDDEKAGYADRVTALTEYTKLEQRAIQLNYDDQIKKLDFQKAALQAKEKTAKGRDLENLKIDVQNINQKEIELKTAHDIAIVNSTIAQGDVMNKIITQQGERAAKLRKDFITNANATLEIDINNQKVKANKDYDDKLAALQTSYDKGLISQEKFLESRKDLENDYSKASLQIEINKIKQLIAFEALMGINISKEMLALTDLERKLAKLSVSDADKANTEKYAKAKKTLNDIAKVSKDVFKVVDQAMQASLDAKLNALQAEQDANDKKAARDIAIVTASTDSEVNKAAKIAIINARSAAQKEEIDRKEKAAKLDKAKVDKEIAIFNVILSTAQGIMSALTSTPPNVPLAIAVGITGAAELVVASTAPLPKFKDGLNKDYEGRAIVGDGGRSEAIVRKDGSIEITPNVDTLAYIEKGDRIMPDANVFMQGLQNSAIRDVARVANGKISQVNYAENMTKVLASKMDKQSKILTAIASKKEIQLGATDRGMTALWNWGANQTKYINENCNW